MRDCQKYIYIYILLTVEQTVDRRTKIKNVINYCYCDSAVGLGTALQAGRSQVRFPMVSMTYSFQPHYGPGVDSASNRNKNQEYFLGVKGSGA